MLFASTDESRYVLNGVCLCAQAERPILITTDGRRLAVIETTAEQPKDYTGNDEQIILRGEFIRAISALSKAIGGKLFPWIEIANTPGSQRVQVSIVGGSCFVESETSALIEGDYPNWKTCIPSKRAIRQPVSEIGLNAECVGDYAKAAKILECETPIVQMALVGKDSAIEVKLIGRPNFYGLVMQCKLQDGTEYQPEFLGIVKDMPKTEPQAEKKTETESVEA